MVVCVCVSELFLMNFTARVLPPFHRSSVAAAERSCLGDDFTSQFCIVEVTADTFSSIVLDPTKVTPVQLGQSSSQCLSWISVMCNFLSVCTLTV